MGPEVNDKTDPQHNDVLHLGHNGLGGTEILPATRPDQSLPSTALSRVFLGHFHDPARGDRTNNFCLFDPSENFGAALTLLACAMARGALAV